jgi:hypothetical protein
MINISDKSRRENQNTDFVLNKDFFLNCTLYEIMWKNVIGLGRPQMTIQYGACAFLLNNIGYRYTLRIYNTHCFSTAAIVRRPRLSVTFLRIFPLMV